MSEWLPGPGVFLSVRLLSITSIVLGLLVKKKLLVFSFYPSYLIRVNVPVRALALFEVGG